MGPRIGYPNLAECDPTFSFVRFLGRNADMIECFFHLNLRLWSRALGATENAESNKLIRKAGMQEEACFFPAFLLSLLFFFFSLCPLCPLGGVLSANCI